MNAAIEFFQTQKSQAILESFLNLIPANCYVVRERKTIQVLASELVVGDIVYIRSGDKVPADLVLIASTDLKVDNSSLTGEAEAQDRYLSDKNTENPLEATNLVFNGTLVVNGEGYGVVIRTGDKTVLGQIAFLTSNEDKRDSPMSAEIAFFVYAMATVAGLTTLVFFCVSKWVRNNSWAISFNFGVGTFTAFVPQGLPATVTVLLSLAAKRMAKRNVLVKDLQGVETLGAITLLATDKTGTLTRNQMTVTYLWGGNKLYCSNLLSSNDKEAVPLDPNAAVPHEILLMSALCTRARFETNEGSLATRPVLGDATEAGLYRNAAMKLFDFEKVEELYPKVFEIPFNSDNKWALTIHKKNHSNGSLMLYLKGAPERVLKLCSTFHDGTKVTPMTDQLRKDFDQMYLFMASKGHRVLAFAGLALPGSEYPSDFQFKKESNNVPTSNLTFYGLVSLEDPPKHGVREAIGHCRTAGVKVMMVTGDHPLTAESIARKINLMLQDTKETIARKRKLTVQEIPESDVHAIVVHGDKIDSLTEKDWDLIFSKEEIIFARTSPKHKLTIVKNAQALGHIVGVTGDGVNDSPALKKADLGIAMNQSGSDVSKEAAAMILIDDNFASVVNGIEEGRLIFQNLKKSIRYTLTHLMPQSN
jgi:sodium/potassium-transporting ATPase subunit alpha